MRYSHQYVKMITQDGVGQNFHAAVLRHLPSLLSQDVHTRIIDDALTIHHSRHAMVHRDFDFRVHLYTSHSHRAEQRTTGVPSQCIYDPFMLHRHIATGEIDPSLWE